MTRTRACDKSAARSRLDQAQAFVEVAEIAHDLGDDSTFNVAGVLAVLAGVAAGDAACCAALGKRSRGQDHREAVAVVKLVPGEGAQMARDLERLLRIKDSAQYGIYTLGGQQVLAAIRQAKSLVRAADRVLIAHR